MSGRRVRLPLLGAAFYVAVPLGEWPALGLSLSAPLLAFVLVETLAASRLRLAPVWLRAAGALWLGCAASLIVNLLAGDISDVAFEEALLLVRFAYWLAVFLAVAAWLPRVDWAPQLAAAFGLGGAALAGLRLLEAARDGVWGSGNPRWLSQNDYGFGFSVFLPFLWWTAAAGPRPLRLWALLACPAAVAAAVGNGSRSSWLASLAGLGVLCWTAAPAVRRRRLGGPAFALAGVFVLLAVAGAGASSSPSGWLDAPADRARSLARLDRDKPFQTRLLLVDKGLELFERSPWFGVGLGRFEKEFADPSGLAEAPWLDRDRFNARTPHNAYVKALAETGIFGFAPLLFLLGSLAWKAPGAARRLASDGETWPAAAVAAGAGAALHLWTMSGLTGSGPWLVLGLVAAAIERDRRMRRTKTS